MLVSRSKYRRLRYRVSTLAHYWRMYERTFPEKSTVLYDVFELDQLSYASFYRTLTRSYRVPLMGNYRFVTVRSYEQLCRYAKVNRKIRGSLERHQPLKVTPPDGGVPGDKLKRRGKKVKTNTSQGTSQRTKRWFDD